MLGASFQGLPLMASSAQERAGMAGVALSLDGNLGKAEGTGPIAKHRFCFWEDLKNVVIGNYSLIKERTAPICRCLCSVEIFYNKPMKGHYSLCFLARTQS